MTVSEADVEMAYRLFLGRNAESRAVLAQHARMYPSLDDMRASFLRSAEFKYALERLAVSAAPPPAPVIRPWTDGVAHIETEIAPSLQEQLTRHVEQTWTQLGETEPHWSVLTHDAYRSDQFAENEQAFYTSGETPVAMFLHALTRCGIDVSGLAEQTCLELGCGVGRITVRLAAQFERVIGIDISAAHLLIAQQVMQRVDRQNVEFVQLTSADLLRRLPRVDAFISIIVLQHNPPPLMKILLDGCLQRLRPNGVGYFQFPYHIPGYGFDTSSYLREITRAGRSSAMEMHALPQHVVFEVVARAGCRVLEMREDQWCGEGINSCTVLVQRL